MLDLHQTICPASSAWKLGIKQRQELILVWSLDIALVVIWTCDLARNFTPQCILALIAATCYVDNKVHKQGSH